MADIFIDADSRLSFAAVGLWHKLHHAYGDSFDSVDTLTVHPDPNAWGPFDEQHDIEAPFSELLALGYADDSEGAVRLFGWVE